MERVLGSLATPQELAEAARPRMHPHNLRVMLQFAHNDLLLASMGTTKEVRPHFARNPQFHHLAQIYSDWPM